MWQRMISGRNLDILAPSPKDVESRDLAKGLARVARWNGQTHGNCVFSVAQHSLFVEAIFTQRNPDAHHAIQLAALLHDGAEYVIGDLISPFKALVGDTYAVIEERLLQTIFQKFGLENHLNPTYQRKIKEADQSAAYCEARQLVGFSEEEAKDHFLPPNDYDDLLPLCKRYFAPMSAEQAERAFLSHLQSLLTRSRDP